MPHWQLMKPQKSTKLKKPTSQIRVIGGRLRGRKIVFPQMVELRPTPNRIRETIFNWLAPYIQQAHCLDLFAGSGALSFEAISRGAGYCLLFDSSADVIQCLLHNRQLFTIDSMDIIQSHFPYPKELIKRKFDIIFLDPPFHHDMIPAAIEWLLDSDCLNRHALIYIELEADSTQITLPINWQWIKDERAGQVRYCLIAAH